MESEMLQTKTATNGSAKKWGKKLICSAILVLVALIVFIGRDRIKGNYKDGHEYVDLGLPSGTLWATYNVGATKPTEYGDYFAWGETKPKKDYSCGTYKWCTVKANGDDVQFTKYVAGDYGLVDSKTVLEAVDDAATANWGGGWRMPTTDEIAELVDGCDWECVKDFKGSGVNGRLGTSTTNGNTIFLPAAGYRYGSGLCSAGSYGGCWSSSLFEDYSSYAYHLYFLDSGIDCTRSRRYLGQSVRAVTR